MNRKVNHTKYSVSYHIISYIEFKREEAILNKLPLTRSLVPRVLKSLFETRLFHIFLQVLSKFNKYFMNYAGRMISKTSPTLQFRPIQKVANLFLTRRTNSDFLQDKL